MARIFGDILKGIRTSREMSQEDFAALLSTTKQVISRYETGQRTPKITVAKEYADTLGVSLSYLLGDFEANAEDSVFSIPNILPMPKMRKVPRLGTIACGEPILAAGNIEGYDSVPDNIRCDFSLRCKGDSMINARIFDGDVVYILSQPMVENGEIAAVLIDDEATLKRVKLYDDHISLEPENPQYRPIVLWGDDMNTVRIIGKAAYFTSVVR